MPKVYITNYAGHDHSSAEKYGQLAYITRGNASFQSLDRLTFRIAEQVVDSDKDDWLLIAGNAFISIAATLIWLTKHKQVKLLVHDYRNRGKYREAIFTDKHIHEIITALSPVTANDVSQKL